MYKIIQHKYHYFYELENFINVGYDEGLEFIQIISQVPSGDHEKMHLATIIFKKNKMIVKVKSCRNPDFWYSEHIGKEFEVNHRSFNRFGHNQFLVKGGIKMIMCEDAEILTGK